MSTSSSAHSSGSTKQKQTPKAGEASTPSNEEVDEENEDLRIPLPQMTKPQRMAWFRTQLAKIEIVKSSNNSSASFHSRVSNFFTQNCSTFFHAIWLSPAEFFGQREYMTMDTLLKVHPQGCLMILSSSMDSILGYRILKPLIDPGLNVLAITPDLPFLVKNTPAETWLEELKSGNKDPGIIPLFNNLSNLMSLAMLYKYGGVYLDIDLIFLKDLSGLRNAIGAQNMDPVTKRWLRLNNAVMIFNMNHPILLDSIEEFALTFDGNRWGLNGPYVVSRVVGRVGSTPGYDLQFCHRRPSTQWTGTRFRTITRSLKMKMGPVWVENKVAELLSGGGTFVEQEDQKARY